ncbi:MAG TPA: PAS domain S-box protein, partial [Phycisphaerae bacterium]|nr:PAS domain S-box protein [Phycisphaerae bacterium]
GILPVVYEGRVIGLLNVASRTAREISPSARDLLEAIAAQIGWAIARVRSREALQAAHDELERRVAERTAELQRANERLQREMAERRQAEEALRASEERYRTLAETAQDCIYIIGPDDRIRYINSYAAAQFGVRPEEVIGKPRSELFPPDVADRQKRGLQRVMQTGEPLMADDIVPFPGRQTWQRTQLVALRDGGSAVIGVLGISRDITDIKRVTDALTQSDERYRTILDQMDEAVIFADAEHIVREINACACSMLGVSRDEVIGRDVLAVHGPALRTRVAEVLRTFREEGHRHAVTARRSFGGRELLFRVSPAYGSDGGYRGIIAVIIDITEQMRMQQQLAEAQKLETVGRLAGGIAHDFNNLMQTVLGSASRLRSKFAPDHPNHALLVRIEQAADTAGRLAHQLLVFAKGGRILPRVVDFAEVVGREVEICRPIVPENIRLDCAIADDLGKVECDTTRTEQVIVNLCRNAIEAMPDGGRLTIRAENVTLASALAHSHPPLPAGEYVCVAVEDTGVGIAPEVRSRLFDPFVTTKPQGHGLGLAAAYGTVRAHGGAIAVDTEPRQGSTFRIWLPRVRPVEE